MEKDIDKLGTLLVTNYPITFVMLSLLQSWKWLL